MTSVLIKKKKRKFVLWDIHTKRMSYRHENKDQDNTFTHQGFQQTNRHYERGKGLFLLHSQQKESAPWYLNQGLLSSGTSNMTNFWVQATQFVVLCNGNPRKLTQK